MLSAAERLLVAQDTLRGLEANLIQAEILGSQDQSQAERIPVLEAQIEAAQAKIEELAPEAEADVQAAAITHFDPNTPGPSVPDRTDEWYEAQTKTDLFTWAATRGLDPKTAWNKDELIAALQEQDAKDAG